MTKTKRRMKKLVARRRSRGIGMRRSQGAKDHTPGRILAFRRKRVSCDRIPPKPPIKTAFPGSPHIHACKSGKCCAILIAEIFSYGNK